jgi:hypothetical protein
LRTFDSVVLGDGIRGSAAAALLTKAGKRVMVIGPSEGTEDGAVAGAFPHSRFQGRPDCAYGFEEGGAWQSLLRDLSIDDVTSADLESYQVAMPDRRITVSADPLETLAELRREYPAEAPELDRFYRDSIDMASRVARNRLAAFLARRRSAQNIIARYRFSRELLAFFSTASYFFFNAPLFELSAAELSLLIARPPRVIEKGLNGLAVRVLDAFRQRGGEYSREVAWPEILLHRNRVTGIVYGQEEVGCHALLLNTARPSREQTYVSIIRKTVVPVGMLDLVLAISDYDRPDDMAVFSLSASSADDAVPEGKMQLQVHFREAHDSGVGNPLLTERISSIVPFITEFTEQARLLDCSERIMPLPPHVTERTIRKGREGLDAVRFSAKNLFLLDDSFFGLGRSVHAVRAVVEGMS